MYESVKCVQIFPQKYSSRQQLCLTHVIILLSLKPGWFV